MKILIPIATTGAAILIGDAFGILGGAILAVFALAFGLALIGAGPDGIHEQNPNK